MVSKKGSESDTRLAYVRKLPFRSCLSCSFRVAARLRESALRRSPDLRRVEDDMDIDPRKRKYQVVPSPWYVHPFEVTDRGVPALLPFYDRGASEASRAEFFADVLFALYGDYFRHGPRMEGRRLVWYCPAADQKDNTFEGELDANNAVEWVEVPDAANTMSDYLSSGDFYRVCADTARDLELNAAGMAPDHAQVELRRAANVLTSFSDLSTDDSLYTALKRHLRERDSRWLRNGISGPATPPSSPVPAPTKPVDGAGKENTRSKTDAWRAFKSSLFVSDAAREDDASPRKALALRRTNSARV